MALKPGADLKLQAKVQVPHFIKIQTASSRGSYMYSEEVDLKKATYMLRSIDRSELLDPFSIGKEGKLGLLTCLL